MVRVTTADGNEVIGVPTAVDPDAGAHEVYLRPVEAEDTEIAIDLAGVTSAEMVQDWP
jgi:hypothetical protein